MNINGDYLCDGCEECRVSSPKRGSFEETKIIMESTADRFRLMADTMFSAGCDFERALSSIMDGVWQLKTDWRTDVALGAQPRNKKRRRAWRRERGVSLREYKTYTRRVQRGDIRA